MTKAYKVELLSTQDYETAKSILKAIFLRKPCSRVRYLWSVPWVLAEFRQNRIVQSPHENYFNVCWQHKEK